MPRKLIRVTCLFGLLSTAGITNAAELPEPPERYEVELIVFRHADQSRNTVEIPAAASIFRASPLDLTLAEMPAQPEGPAAPFEIYATHPSAPVRRPPISFYLIELDPAFPDFVPLRDAKHTLDQVYEHLGRIDAYEPLVHIGWVQSAQDADNAKPYRFTPETIGDAGLVGTVTLHKERYLHLEVDLVLEAAPPPVETLFLLRRDESESPEEYKLTESRRIRGTAVHYFDHPRFGLIARIQAAGAALAETSSRP